MKAVFDRVSIGFVRLMPLIRKTTTIDIDRTASDAKAIPAVIKKDFKILWSFDL